MCKERNLIAAALAVLFLIAVPNALANLDINGGMELDEDTNGEPDNWSHFGTAPSDNTVLTQDTDMAPGNGTYSALLSNGPAFGPHWFWQDILVDPETYYRFEFWFKGNALQVHFENPNWGDGTNHMAGEGTCFWYWWNGQPATPNPETEWVHATHHDANAPGPWIIQTEPGQTSMQVLFEALHGIPNPNDVRIDEVSLTLAADANGDGFIGAIDWNRVLDNWGKTGASLADGDFDGDGTVGGPDYTMLINDWGKGVFPGPPEAPGAIPEPGTLLILGGGLLGAFVRRR